MNIRKPFLALLLSLLLAGPSVFGTTVGLSSSSLNGVYAEQKQSQWCWAACIQMITGLYGADLTQEEVVARTYGPGVNRAGTLEVITANLNGRGFTHNGRSYTINSQMLANNLLPAALVAELSAGHPVLLGCNAGGKGHAVVCTAVSYEGDADAPAITALTVRDPWPSESNRADAGRQVLRGSDLGPRILEGWIIHVAVQETDGSAVPAPQGYVFNDDNSPAWTPRPQPPLVATNNLPQPVRRNDDALVDATVQLLRQVQSLLTAR